ncbi:hypothetical protein M9H77_06687 [Catharanthus roseus]|uniref:Uncharacterized protein n=1 Tax=Catharanthus roseus TaxID=4058 RepID=A0ACC0BT31_CATRO|nr:hypothetical protein M9H77_06687 [Catharanthus roseus]
MSQKFCGQNPTANGKAQPTIGSRSRLGNNTYPNQHSLGWRNQPDTTITPLSGFKNRSLNPYPPYNPNPPSPSPSLEYFVLKYVNLVNVGVKSIEVVKMSKTASLHNLESLIGKLTRMITESPPGNLPGNPRDKSIEDAKMVTLRSRKELIKKSPTIVEEEKGTAEAQVDSTPPKEKEAQQKEVIKLLGYGIIHHISYNIWVSLVQVIPKKGGMMVVANKNSS